MEFERKLTANGEIISASTVRSLAGKKGFEKLEAFATPATVEYLKNKKS